MKKNKIIPKVLLAVLVIALLVAEYFVCTYAYKRGYAEGTNNQVICQASVSNQSLSKLCK